MLGSALGGTFCLEVSERKAPCRYKGLWLSGQDPLSSPLALIPPNKRSLLPKGQESPTGQALSSACSIFPVPLGSFNGSDSHPPSSDPGGSQQTVVVALSPPMLPPPAAGTGTPIHPTQHPQTGLVAGAGAGLLCLSPGLDPSVPALQKDAACRVLGVQWWSGLKLAGPSGSWGIPPLLQTPQHRRSLKSDLVQWLGDCSFWEAVWAGMLDLS